MIAGLRTLLATAVPAEPEEFGIVADEGDAFGWVAWLRAEVARFDSGEQSV